MSLRAGRLEQAALRLSNVDRGRKQRVVAMRGAMRSSVKCSMWDVPAGLIRGRYLSWSLGKSIRLRFKTGLHLWRK